MPVSTELMPVAIAHYPALGFTRCAPCHEILDGFLDATVFMETSLTP
ncbi:MAG: hypothetical protein ABI960_09230 [Candidatus Eisenbacteria bacterium]